MAAGASPSGTVEQRLRAWLDVPLSSLPTVTHDGASVLFVGTGGGLPELWQVGAERGPERPVGLSTERVGTVDASPTDPKAIVTTDRGGNEHWQLHLLEPSEASGHSLPRLRALTEEPEVIHLPGRWSSDGRSYLFSSNRRDRRFFDVERLTLGSRPRRDPVLTGDAYHSVIDEWGGRALVLRSNTNLDADLLEVGADGPRLLTRHEGELTILSAALTSEAVYAAANPGREHTALVRYRGEAGRHEFVREFPGDLETIVPSPDRTQLLLSVNRDGWSETHLFDPSTRDDRLLNSGPRGVIGRLAWVPDASAVIYDLSNVEGVDLWRRSIATGKERRLTGRAGALPSGVAPPRLAKFRASDRVEVAYWEYEPAGGSPRGTIVHVHGGPESQARPGFAPFLLFLVAEGWRVVAPNVRGSTGYGRTFTHLDDVRRRPDSVRDLAELSEELVRRGRASPGRLGLIGGSYGGYMVLAAAAGYPKLWGAAVDLVGIANFVTFLERTGAWRRRLREAEYGSLETDRDFLTSISPLTNVGEIRAPLLVLHGRNDPRVPVGEAEQIAAALRRLGRPVELLVFEDEGHGIVRRENQVTAWGRAAAFFESHLGSPGG